MSGIHNVHHAVHAAWSMANSGFNFAPVIAANTTNYNLKSAAIAAGWDQVKPLNATITINAGVAVGSTSTSTYAFDTGTSFPTGSTLAIINNGYIVGAGGQGGNASSTNGAVGGPALRAQVPISITNNGTIGGGGGGGGGGQGLGYNSVDGYGNVTATYTSGGGGGGGGAGYNGGGGGSITHGNYAGIRYGTAGGAGTTTAGGGGGSSDYGTNSPNSYMQGGPGGSGGALGAAGGSGGGGGYAGEAGWYGGPTFVWYNATSGGAGGAAVVGNANITWIATGTRAGSIS